MIDFTNCQTKKKAYTGANGSKISIVYNGVQYMLKFPSNSPKNDNLSYANGCISEYIGCHIFQSVGIITQETLLGTYYKNGKEKIVVACKDFTIPGVILQDFASLKNTIIDSAHNGYGTELDGIIETIDNQQSIDSVQLKQWFWDMFIVDALIGNWDRHNGNWGFLYNTNTDEVKIAPIYDCGSCLYPQADELMMNRVLTDKHERDIRVYEKPLSSIKVDNKKLNYCSYITSLSNNDCNDALKRIVPKIDMIKINSIIDNTDYISNLQKEFYKTMLKTRKEKILDFSYKKIKTREHQNSYER